MYLAIIIIIIITIIIVVGSAEQPIAGMDFFFDACVRTRDGGEYGCYYIN